MPVTVSLRLGLDFSQAWYSDDAPQMQVLMIWSDKLCKLGPACGYRPRRRSPWLVIKQGMREKAERIRHRSLQLTEDGSARWSTTYGERGSEPPSARRSAFINDSLERQGLQVVGQHPGPECHRKDPSHMLRTRRTYSAQATARRLYTGGMWQSRAADERS